MSSEAPSTNMRGDLFSLIHGGQYVNDLMNNVFNNPLAVDNIQYVANVEKAFGEGGGGGGHPSLCICLQTATSPRVSPFHGVRRDETEPTRPHT